ncbi:MAG: hypothetical protein LBV80_10910 [Deltaproteobacteria bacterium]|jgi:hypothetical protein|nr:hypothetical protein [Deltaproteobacteria bacterium]
MKKLRKFIYRPRQSGYSAADGTAEYLRVQLAGGAARYRRDIEGGNKRVNCGWVLGREGYDYALAFYRSFVHSMEPFEIDLILGEWGLTPCKAWFVPESFRLEGQRGNAFYLAAELEVTPPYYDSRLDSALVDLAGAFGEGWPGWAGRLDLAVNRQAPAVFSGF